MDEVTLSKLEFKLSQMWPGLGHAQISNVAELKLVGEKNWLKL